jgi:hypothetical protein
MKNLQFKTGDTVFVTSQYNEFLSTCNGAAEILRKDRVGQKCTIVRPMINGYWVRFDQGKNAGIPSRNDLEKRKTGAH